MGWFPTAGTRRASVVLLAIAFASIAGVSWRQALALRTELEAREARLAQTELTSILETWESAVLERVDLWLEDVEVTDDLATQEHNLRTSSDTFAAYFIWEAGPTGPHFIYPQDPLEEDIPKLLDDPCVAAAVGRSGGNNLDDAATGFLSCGQDDPALRLFARSRAADIFLSAGRPDLAVDVLRDVKPDLSTTLAASTNLGWPLYRIAVRRLELAQALGAIGDHRTQQLILHQTGREILDLNGRSLELLLPFIAYPILADLSDLHADAAVQELSIQQRDAQQRLRGYRQAREIASAPVSHLGVELVHVEAGPDPFALAIGATNQDGWTTAVELDQKGLLTSLARGLRTDLQRHLVVLDATGKIQMASREAPTEEPVWVQVPFERLLPHLRLGVLRSEESGQRDSERWLLLQLIPLGAALAMGIFALVGMMVADRRLEQVYERQRAFLARVTHELKTPLAGIRVMAESIELGLPAATVSDMTRRILSESDRLAQRIDEILRVARDPRPPQPTQIEPSELATKLAQTWEERFQHAGGQLLVSSAVAEPFTADRAMVYDALNNLVDNAFKYRREDRPPRCIVRIGATRRWIVVDVSDNGIGVPVGKRRAIFEPFVRVETPGRGKSGGHGLGLSFVAETARAHGGAVECREGIDGGSRFILRIRRKR